MNELLKLKSVDFYYQTKTDEIHALKDITFSVDKEEFISIVGPSGCGKTTILSLIAGLLTPSSGEILLNGKPITDSHNSIGYMFQRDQLFEWRTIWQNIILGLEIQGKSKDEAKLEEINELLSKYELKAFKDRKPSELSGGMRQRVALIRTLTLNPELLLLDEPFSALDFQTRLKVCDDVEAIIKNEKRTAILVTHDISEAISMSDKVVVLTKRPATVRSIETLNLSGKTPLQRREDKNFSPSFEKIWRTVTDEN